MKKTIFSMLIALMLLLPIVVNAATEDPTASVNTTTVEATADPSASGTTDVSPTATTRQTTKPTTKPTASATVAPTATTSTTPSSNTAYYLYMGLVGLLIVALIVFIIYSNRTPKKGKSKRK